MLFSSPYFFVFFPVTALLCALTFGAARTWVLLAASAVFYMALVPEYLLIPLTMIAAGYAAGRGIEGASGPARRKVWFAAGLAVNLAILFAFKYLDFAMSSAAAAVRWTGADAIWTLRNWVLPLGLSFQTFQAISYLAEVYSGNWPAERNLPRFALYFLFYPQLPAGPISPPDALLRQFQNWRRENGEAITAGLRLMAWGLFKKAAVADRLNLVVEAAFREPDSRTGPQIAAGAVLFLMQLYCDFSGYCDIGRGAAQTMGISLIPNFRAPFNSVSIREFWRRWNVSLANWLRDYIFFPAGGGRRSTRAAAAATLLVFFVSGLWHGAQWNFVAWGLLNGLYCCIELVLEPRTPRVTGWRVWARRGVILALVAFSMLFFRAPSPGDAATLVSRLASGWSIAGLAGQAGVLGVTMRWAVIQGAVVAFVLAAEGDRTGPRLWKLIEPRPVVRWACYYALMFALLLVLEPGQGFIYAQF